MDGSAKLSGRLLPRALLLAVRRNAGFVFNSGRRWQPDVDSGVRQQRWWWWRRRREGKDCRSWHDQVDERERDAVAVTGNAGSQSLATKRAARYSVRWRIHHNKVRRRRLVSRARRQTRPNGRSAAAASFIRRLASCVRRGQAFPSHSKPCFSQINRPHWSL